MCGFNVILKKRKDYKIDDGKFLKASNIIAHRGPDSNGYYEDDLIKISFFRLSIMDLSSRANQPMFSFNRRYVIAFNGEIYNKDELSFKINRKKLKTTSDTEVLINLFQKYKENCLNMIKGMFSFVIYDRINKQVFFARDRFGIKPLYFHISKNHFFFSSEIKPIVFYNKINSFDEKMEADFFFNQEIESNGKTFFKEISNLKSGHFGKIIKNKISFFRYWQLENKKINQSNLQKRNNLRELFKKSVKSHLLSDVNTGLLLSSGTDSKALGYEIKKGKKKFNTYTYDFKNDKDYGESKIASKVSKDLKAKHFIEYIDEKFVINNFEKMTSIIESPFTSIRLFGDLKLYNKCRLNNDKVVLVGHGGDEIFGGYEYNFFSALIENFLKTKNYSEIIKFTKKTGNNLIRNIDMFYDQSSISRDGKKTIFKTNFEKDFIDTYYRRLNMNFEDNKNNYNLLQKSQLADIFVRSLSRNLKYCDRISMHNSVEARIPFLDHDLFEYGFNLSPNDQYAKEISRKIFKEFIKRSYKVKFDSVKKNITDPQKEWMRSGFKEFFLDTLNSLEFKKIEFLNHKNIRKNYDDFTKKKFDTSLGLFQILSYFYFKKIFSKKII